MCLRVALVLMCTVISLAELADVQCNVAPRERENCGYSGISRDECTSKGCCFDSSVPGVYWCYKSFQTTTTTSATTTTTTTTTTATTTTATTKASGATTTATTKASGTTTTATTKASGTTTTATTKASGTTTTATTKASGTTTRAASQTTQTTQGVTAPNTTRPDNGPIDMAAEPQTTKSPNSVSQTNSTTLASSSGALWSRSPPASILCLMSVVFIVIAAM